jgi:hypothetical protein
LTLSSRICWVSAVGDDPSKGGGVARSLYLLKKSELIQNNNGNFYSLHGLNKFKQIFLCIYLLINGSRHFVVHSFFTPFTLFLLCIPFPLKVVILPHGELKSGALNINASKKILFINMVRLFYFINRYFKKIGAIATNTEELTFLRSIAPISNAEKIADFFTSDIVLTKKKNFTNRSEINIVTLARMVPNKGLADFLMFFGMHLKSSEKDWSKKVKNIYIFYIEENKSELKLVKQLSKKLMVQHNINVYLFSGLHPEIISARLEKIPNKLGFIPSRFESFSYTLIESLGYEYKPVVWFDNELVDLLFKKKLCSKAQYGKFLSIDGESLIQLAKPENNKIILQEMALDILKSYQIFFENFFKHLK